MRPELHDRGDDLGRDLREFGDEHRGEQLLDLRLVLLEAAGALDLEQVRAFFDINLVRERGTGPEEYRIQAWVWVIIQNCYVQRRFLMIPRVHIIINANVSARLILGLSKCGMHGEEPVRLKRLKRPWVDQD